MKQLVLTFILAIAFYGYISAQRLPELEKVKEIKLLEHTREDVQRILSVYKRQNINYRYVAPPTHLDSFISENSEIQITYSEGKCESKEETAIWDIDEGKVVSVEVIPNKPLTLNEIGLSLSKYKRENTYTNQKDYKIYHRKDLGIAIQTERTKVNSISFEPPRKYYLMLCDKKLAERLLRTSSYFDPAVKDRNLIIDYFPHVNVKNLILSSTEIIANLQNEPKEIAILLVAENPNYDILTYNYSVTGGKIIGVGGRLPSASDKVFWDLTGVKPGTYTITAAVDNGCGFCGKMITKSVIVKECVDCKNP